MSVLTSIEKDFNYLYKRQNELDLLISKFGLSNEDRKNVEKLKIEISNILTDILSTKCEDVLSASFYLQINNIEQEIYNILDDKKKVLNELLSYKQEICDTAKIIFSLIYSIDILENSFHINIKSPMYLLDIKSLVKSKDVCSKKIIALEFLKEKLNLYKKGMIELIQISSKNKLKSSLSFEKRQKIFNIFSSISLSSNRAKNHKKAYNEDIENKNDDIYTIEYLKYFENIFIELCNYVNLSVYPYYDEIKNALFSNTLNDENILNITDYIYNRYQSQINLFLNKQIKIRDNANYNIKKNLNNCLSYEGSTDIYEILDKVENKKILPEYLENSNYKENLENLLFNLDISYKDNITMQKIMDELQDEIIYLFDEEKYLKMYKNNSNLNSIQIANYRQYYISILEIAKENLKEKYKEKIELYIAKKDFSKYKTSDLVEKIKNLENDIDLLKQALDYINKNYRDFGKANLKLYMYSIQSRYNIQNLYDNVIARKSNLAYKVMAKNKLKQQEKYLYEFVNRKDIKQKLQNEIINNIFKDSDNLKEELLNKII